MDDSPDVADCLCMLLRYLGHWPVACSSGYDCLGLLREVRPDVILLDLTMPCVDGFETCRRIREAGDFRTVPVIACTALDRDTVSDRAVDCGFNGYLAKPVSSSALQAAIEQAVGVVHGPRPFTAHTRVPVPRVQSTHSLQGMTTPIR